jgi:hypothetical protein
MITLDCLHINLLFLPPTFCSSIFGMQAILLSSVHPSWFAITICVVTAFTAFLERGQKDSENECTDTNDHTGLKPDKHYK